MRAKNVDMKRAQNKTIGRRTGPRCGTDFGVSGIAISQFHRPFCPTWPHTPSVTLDRSETDYTRAVEILLPRRLTQAAWGRGYATEAANSALADGFNRCGFERVIATVQPANLASAGVATKLGMCSIDDPQEADQNDEQNPDLLVFAITREEWACASARL